MRKHIHLNQRVMQNEPDQPDQPDSTPITTRNVGFNPDAPFAKESLIEAIYKDARKVAKAKQEGGDYWQEKLSIHQLQEILTGQSASEG